MPAVARKGDMVNSSSGSGGPLLFCAVPMATKVDEVNGSSVYANGKLIPVKGNKIEPHPIKYCGVDDSILAVYSPNVFIGGKGVGRVGDIYKTDSDSAEQNIIAEGSSDVFANS